MNIEMYGSKRIYFPANDCYIVIVRTPCPQEPYGAQLEDQEGEPIRAWGNTPLAAIAALNEALSDAE
jgi:hypothetical protein